MDSSLCPTFPVIVPLSSDQMLQGGRMKGGRSQYRRSNKWPVQKGGLSNLKGRQRKVAAVMMAAVR